MGRLREFMPIINIFAWSDGNNYTAEDTTPLDKNSNDQTEKILAESQAKLKEQYEAPSGKSGKGKGKSQFKVDKSELGKDEEVSTTKSKAKESKEQEKEIGE